MKNQTKRLCACMCILGLCTLQPIKIAAADITETSDWYNTDKTIAITPGADTGGSGTKEAQYKLGDAADWTTYSSPITVTETTTVHMRTLDNAGNISELRSLTVQIDRDAPTEPGIDKSPAADWTNQTVTCTLVDGTDAGSGIDHTEYQVDAADWTQYTTAITFDASANLAARTFDAAGNISSTSTMAIQIDTVLPDVPTFEIQ